MILKTPLTVKYKPNSLDKFYNKELVNTIENKIKEIDSEKIILITGESGNGKTVLAQLIAKQHSEIVADIDPMSTSKEILHKLLDNSMEITEQVSIVIDNADTLGEQVQRSLVDFLEGLKGISRILVIFVTDKPDMLLETLKSYCNINIDVPNPTKEELVHKLFELATFENIKVSKEVLELIVEKENISIRECINIFEGITSLYETINLENIKAYLNSNSTKDTSNIS